MYAIIVTCILIVAVIISVLIIKSHIKKIKAVEYNLELAERELHQMYENIKVYENKQYKLEKIKVKYENLKREINNYSGKSLADIANEL